MKKIMIRVVGLMFVAAIYPAAEVQAVGAEATSAVGQAKFFWSGADIEEIPKGKAFEKLSAKCRKQDKVLFKGRVGGGFYNYAAVKFSGLSCKTNKSGKKKCKITASGKCLPKGWHNRFSVKCGDKKVKGRIEWLPKGIVRLHRNDGSTVHTISRATVTEARELEARKRATRATPEPDAGILAKPNPVVAQLCSNDESESSVIWSTLRKQLYKSQKKDHEECLKLAEEAKAKGEEPPQDCGKSGGAGPYLGRRG